MKSEIVGLQLLLVAYCSGLTIPLGLPDGVYSIEFNPLSNKIINEPTFIQHIIEANTTTKVTARQDPPPLENPKPSCGQRDLNRNDFNTAKQQFEFICETDRQYPANMAVVITYQGAMAFMCNFGSGNRCWRQEYNEASGIMDKQCGQNRIATVYVDRWKKNYGRDIAGAEICT